MILVHIKHKHRFWWFRKSPLVSTTMFTILRLKIRLDWRGWTMKSHCTHRYNFRLNFQNFTTFQSFSISFKSAVKETLRNISITDRFKHWCLWNHPNITIWWTVFHLPSCLLSWLFPCRWCDGDETMTFWDSD